MQKKVPLATREEERKFIAGLTVFLEGHYSVPELIEILDTLMITDPSGLRECYKCKGLDRHERFVTMPDGDEICDQCADVILHTSGICTPEICRLCLAAKYDEEIKLARKE